jgi:hypothetical protein
MTASPVNNLEHPDLHEFLLKTDTLTIAKAQKNNFHILNLCKQLKNNLNLRVNDDIH